MFRLTLPVALQVKSWKVRKTKDPKVVSMTCDLLPGVTVRRVKAPGYAVQYWAEYEGSPGTPWHRSGRSLEDAISLLRSFHDGSRALLDPLYR